jgi:hypothetical protein
MEICLIKAASGSTVTLMRGIFDTTPKAWAAGTGIWILPPDAVIDDSQIREPGETAVYRPLSRTSKGMLDYSAATPITGLMTARPWAPSRPADVKVNTVASGAVEAIGASTLAVTWKTRNRLNEDSLILDWDDAFVTPETGQTTSILVLNVSTRDVLSRTDGITGNSYTLPVSAFAGNGSGIIRVIAVRDGLDSIQGHEITALVASGYGYGYGFNYGKS